MHITRQNEFVFVAENWHRNEVNASFDKVVCDLQRLAKVDGRLGSSLELLCQLVGQLV